VPNRYATVDAYISSFPEDVQTVLRDVRRTIRNTVPNAEETISYQMPAMTLEGRHLVYFAAWKRHISIYPIPAGDDDLERDLAPYRAARGTARFPFDKPLPGELIERLVMRLVEQRADASRSTPPGAPGPSQG
jgi:uncharacterized protein YdhG (YjbR/CyaY superfamily)